MYTPTPVHPADRPLLGIRWEGACYIDGALPFGLRSAPKLFTALADALQWVLIARGVDTIDHYLDDFITMGPAGSDQCRRNLDLILAICDELGVPLATDKLEGPRVALRF